jgi:hypothetical protein
VNTWVEKNLDMLYADKDIRKKFTKVSHSHSSNTQFLKKFGGINFMRSFLSAE